MPAPQYPQVEIPRDLPNLGTIMAAAGYATPSKGKWHCSKPVNGNTAPAQPPPCTPDEGWAPEDVNRFGFERWNPQDAGANQFICQAGGGVVDNDARHMTADGGAEAGHEGAPLSPFGGGPAAALLTPRTTANGMIQKTFNAYEETLRVPLVCSIPAFFPEAMQSDTLARPCAPDGSAPTSGRGTTAKSTPPRLPTSPGPASPATTNRRRPGDAPRSDVDDCRPDAHDARIVDSAW